MTRSPLAASSTAWYSHMSALKGQPEMRTTGCAVGAPQSLKYNLVPSLALHVGMLVSPADDVMSAGKSVHARGQSISRSRSRLSAKLLGSRCLEAAHEVGAIRVAQPPFQD